MKNINFSLLKKPLPLFYHFFAVIGMVGSLLFAISWSGDIAGKSDLSDVSLGSSPDVSIAPASARGYVDAYHSRYSKEGSLLPKGYFISKASIEFMLQDESLNGIYVYPAINATGTGCIIVEPGVSANAAHRTVEGVAGKVVMGESPCPNDCGALMR